MSIVGRERKAVVTLFGALLSLGALAAAAHCWSDEPTTERKPEPAKPDVVKSDEVKPEAVERARQQAKLVHTIYSTTLDVIHERYFRSDRSAIPARAMEEVFTEVQRQSKVKARWISVNTTPMSIDHEPRDQFERDAAKALGQGQDSFEQVLENGVYRRAEGIPLTAGCLTCHGTFGVTPKTPRFAGLVISIPLK